MNEQQLASVITAALKARPPLVRKVPVKDHGDHCTCGSESGTLLFRVVATKAGEIVVWFRSSERLPEAAMTTVSISEMPAGTWLQFPRCRACGMTWIATARAVDGDLDVWAKPRSSHQRSVVVE